MQCSAFIFQCCGTTIYYGFGSDFRHVTSPVQVSAPAPYLDLKKHSFQQKFWEKILPVYIVSFFTRKKLIGFIRIIVQM
jgi:hypothetical protein